MLQPLRHRLTLKRSSQNRSSAKDISASFLAEPYQCEATETFSNQRQSDAVLFIRHHKGEPHHENRNETICRRFASA